MPLYRHLVDFLQLRLPVHSYFALGPQVPVPVQVTFFDWVVVAQRRYWASLQTSNSTNLLVAVRQGPGIYKVGELTSIFTFKLKIPTCPFVHLGMVRYLKPVLDAFPSQSAWSSTYVDLFYFYLHNKGLVLMSNCNCSSDLRLSVFEQAQFEAEAEFIKLDDIVSPVMIAEARVWKQNRWIAVFLNHVCLLYSSLLQLALTISL
jgi:hypothetical protein